MADANLKRRIRDVLKSGYFSDEDDVVHVSDGEVEDTVHVIVISEKFVGERLGAKTDLITSELTQNLPPEEWGKVTLAVGVTPSEVKAM